jgi:hypothetical protein
MKTDYTTHIVYINYLLPLGEEQVIEETETSHAFRAKLDGRVTMNQFMDSMETLIEAGSIDSYYIHPKEETLKIVTFTFDTITINPKQ